MNRRVWISMLALVGASLVSQSASADIPKKRAVPDYDGRGGEPTTAGDVLIWIPRVVLSPLYFVSEYLIRRPLGAVLTLAEKANLPDVLYNFFAFGPDHKAGFAPYALIDFGFLPSVGIYTFWNDAGVKGHDVAIHAAGWNSEWLAAGLTDRVPFGPNRTLTLAATGIRRPDHAFFGLGPNSTQGNISRYSEDSLDANATLSFKLWRASSINMTSGARSVSFGPGDFGKDPTVEQEDARDVYALPPGFTRGYTLQYNQINLAFDNRKPRPASGSGVRVELHGFQGNDLREHIASSFVRYGAQIGGFYDLNDHGRVVSLSVATEFADPLGKEPVPFTELVTFGGYDYMRGFYPGRLYDRSGAVATLKYRWPIWSFVDGSMQLATGNVFGTHLDEFDPKLLRLSGSLGIETVGSPDNSLEILVGAGTETFDHGMQLDSIRILVGTNRGF
jgi:Omp85 superfamily domain